jgi:hypothetical protein
MNTKPLLLVSIILLIPGASRSQGGVDGYPFDIPADPRSVAMGESFVALPSNPAALMYNPSGLAGLQGISLSYSRRALNAVSAIDEYMSHSVSGAFAVPFGVFGVQYNRKSLGTLVVTTAANPDGPGTEATYYYSHDLAIGFGTRLINGLALGAAAKYYDFVESSSGPAYLFDVGLLYTLPPMHGPTVIDDSLSIGLSVQNFGTQRNATARGFEIRQDLPEYFRIGLSYSIRTMPGEESALTPVGIVVTGEYRNLLNQNSILHEGRSYWGAGIEASVFEILCLRAGAYTQPFTWFDGERDRPAYRYGVGLNVPLRKIGSGLPLMISLNYSVEPLDQIVNPSLTGYTEKVSLPAFSLDLRYVANLW